MGRININLGEVMKRRRMSLNELGERVGLDLSNLSLLKNGHVKAIRFSTLISLCKVLECQPGDILEYVDDKGDEEE